MMKEIDIGISTWAYQDLSLAEALEKIACMTKRAEILCETGHSLLDKENVAAARSFDLDYSVHGLITDVNIASIHEAIRSASVELHRQAIEASAEIGASVYVVHPGYTSYPFYREAALRALDRSLEELRPLQDEYGIRLAVENMPKSDWLFYPRPGTLDLKGLPTVLDVGHANTCGSLGEFLVSSEVVHMHLHDNAGERDDHLSLGRGSIDFRPILEKLASGRASAVLENKTEDAVLESLRALGKINDGVVRNA